MATLWGDVANKVVDKIKTVCPYAKVQLIGAVEEYVNNNVAQTIVDEVNILVAPPRGDSYVPSNEPLIGGMFRKRFDVEIVVVAKSDPKMVGRLLGSPSKRGIDTVLKDIHAALEHNNLGGFMDNKAGSNFEVGWEKLPQEDRAVTIFTTIYTAIKTER